MLKPNTVDTNLLKRQKLSLIKIISEDKVGTTAILHLNGILSLLDFIGDHLEYSGSITLIVK